MSSDHQRLSEPSLPEYELIRAADSMPELTPELRSATLMVCQTRILRARKLHRFRIASLAVVAASAVFVVWSMFTISPSADQQPLAQDPADHSETGPGLWRATTGFVRQTGAVLSLGDPGRNSTQKIIDGAIENINRRAQDLLDAGIIPGL